MTKMTAAQFSELWDATVAELLRRGMLAPEATIGDLDAAKEKAVAAHIAAQIEGADDAG